MPKQLKVGRVLTDAEIRDLLAVMPPLVGRAAVFLLHTGLRRGELLALDWKRIRRAQEGHTEAEIGGVGGPVTKTGKSRVAPLHPAAVAAMGPPQAAGPIFPGVDENLSNQVSGAAAIAGLGRVRVHDLRHTWATRYMQATGDLFGLMALGGWTSINSVAQYQHLTKGRAQSVMTVKYEGLPTISPLIGGGGKVAPSKKTKSTSA